jgi:hypothetical protein
MQALFQTTTQGTTKIFEQLNANQQQGGDQYRSFAYDSPDWVYDKPNDPKETRAYRGRLWSFCPKCGHDGKWVCTHTAMTHRSSEFLSHKSTYKGDSPHDYRGRSIDRRNRDQDYAKQPGGSSRSRSRTPPVLRSNSPMHPPSLSAQLSLFDEINAFMGAD